jgi:hypothetical protein
MLADTSSAVNLDGAFFTAGIAITGISNSSTPFFKVAVAASAFTPSFVRPARSMRCSFARPTITNATAVPTR